MAATRQKDPLVVREVMGIPVYEVNPSIPAKDAISRPKKRRLGDEQKGLVIATGSGEILSPGSAVIYEWEEVDSEKFVKLFIGGLKKAAGLSKAGLQMFEFIYAQMRDRPNYDQVSLSFYTASKAVKRLTERTYQRGVRELIDQKILYKSPIEGQFFVDITCMFNGDRLAFVKGYHLKGSQHVLPLPDEDQPATT